METGNSFFNVCYQKICSVLTYFVRGFIESMPQFPFNILFEIFIPGLHAHKLTDVACTYTE